MEIKITTLSENTAGAFDLVGEWGLSILVEAYGTRVLLDTCRDLIAVRNADELGIDLAVIDKIVLSHGHHDHTGGLRNVLSKINGRGIEVIAHPDVFAPKYARHQNIDRFVGIPFSQKELEDAGAHFQLATTPITINDHILTTGEIPMVTGYEQVDTALYVKQGDSR